LDIKALIPFLNFQMSENKINFKELKKELKGIEKISKEILDIKSWESEIHLWIKLEEVKRKIKEKEIENRIIVKNKNQLHP